MIQFIKKYWGSYFFKTTLIVMLSTVIILCSVMLISRHRAIELNMQIAETRLIDLSNIVANLFTPARYQDIQQLSLNIQKHQLVLDKKQLAVLDEDDKMSKDSISLIPSNLVQDLEASAEYQNILKILQFICDATYRSYDNHFFLLPQIQDVYLLTPVKLNGSTIAFMDAVDNFERHGVRSKSKYWQQKLRLGSLLPAASFLKSALKGTPYVSRSTQITSRDWWVLSAFPIKNTNGDVIALLVLEYNANQAGTLLDQFNKYFYLVFPLALSLALIVSILVSRQLAKPISQLTKAAQRIRQHDYSVQIPTQGQDQLGLLMETFNSMTTEIRTYTTDLEKLVDSYARFIPHEFLQLLNLESITEVELGKQIERYMSVLFCDIRSFTHTIEYLSPQEAIEFLNSYLQFVAPIVRLHNGYIDKYIGDAIMAIFPSCPSDALSCAIKVLTETKKFNAEQAARNLPPIRVAIGIHSGSLMLGTVGESLRMEATVISDTVNLAARIDMLAKQLNIDVAISASTQESILSNQQFSFRYIGKLRAKGKYEIIGLYEVLNHLDPAIIALKLATADELKIAIDLIESGNFRAAVPILNKLQIELPEDGVILGYLQLCQQRKTILTNH